MSFGGGTSGNGNVVLPLGVCVLAWVWHAADGTMSVYCNGAPLQFFAGTPLPNPGAPTGTWTSSMGAGDWSSRVHPLAGDQIVAVAVQPVEASAAQAQALTCPTGNRFVLAAGATSGATYDFNASRDWNGAASTITSHGTTPITYAVAGSPTLTRLDEMRFDMTLAACPWVQDSTLAIPRTDVNGASHMVRSPFAGFAARTDAPAVTVEAWSWLSGGDNQAVTMKLTASVNGAYAGALPLTDDGAVWPGQAQYRQAIPVAQSAGAGATVLVRAGLGNLKGLALPYTPGGVLVDAIRLPVYLADGVTSANSSMLTAPTSAAHVLVVVGDDAFGGGYNASVPGHTDAIALLRAAGPGSGTGSVVSGSFSPETFADFISSPYAAAYQAAIAAALNRATSTAVCVFGLGANDYAMATMTPTAMAAAYTTLLQSLHAAAPAATRSCSASCTGRRRRRSRRSPSRISGRRSPASRQRRSRGTSPTSTGRGRASSAAGSIRGRTATARSSTIRARRQLEAALVGYY